MWTKYFQFIIHATYAYQKEFKSLVFSRNEAEDSSDRFEIFFIINCASIFYLPTGKQLENKVVSIH